MEYICWKPEQLSMSSTKQLVVKATLYMYHIVLFYPQHTNSYEFQGITG